MSEWELPDGGGSSDTGCYLAPFSHFLEGELWRKKAISSIFVTLRQEMRFND
jgi:hypothetical protein